jgi:hypothetical protein
MSLYQHALGTEQSSMDPKNTTKVIILEHKNSN